MYSEDSAIAEMIMQQPQGGRPKSHWPDDKKTQDVRFERFLSSRKKLMVTRWDDEIRVDIRLWEEDGTRATKKGVSLPLTRWKILTNNINVLSEALDKEERAELTSAVSLHLGGGQYAGVMPHYSVVDLRQYFMTEDGEVKPTRKGVTLNRNEWENLIASLSEISAVLPEMALVSSCLQRDDHQNQEGALRCRECHPFSHWL